ncbi:glycine cleavage system protein GcvH [Maricaulis alexandrii]|uniref:glycine cleavage system protein GcvH n=1 Tax=Maricaulis alexandrii TaxID=2570354 RepID=UPI001109E555|nr:glycine cleavage system protein GcvH [Maricaulis alexandrii]
MTTRYTEDHEWITVEGDIATVGITAYAAGQLGDVVFVELPEVGKTLAKGDEFAVVESVKAASEVYAPVDGEITAINDSLEGEPATVNEDPSGAGWFVKIKLSDASQLDGLMDEAAYNAHTA